MLKAPCENCEDRVIGCHSKCKKYLKYKEEKQIRDDKINKQKQIDNDWYETKEAKFRRLSRKR